MSILFFFQFSRCTRKIRLNVLYRFLGTVDKLGTAYSDPVIASGYGAYMATPILRKAYAENKEMSKEQAIDLVYKVMQVLYYRDARSFPKVSCHLLKLYEAKFERNEFQCFQYQLGIIKKDGGVEIQGPLTLDGYWGPAVM